MTYPTTLPDDATIVQCYKPAMAIMTKADADAYLHILVKRSVRLSQTSQAEAEQTECFNIGYWSGYYDMETQQRMQTLFGAVYPVFGDVIPTLGEAFAMGQDYYAHEQQRRADLHAAATAPAATKAVQIHALVEEMREANAKVDMGDDHCAADAVLCKALLVLAAETPAHALVTQLLAAYDAIHPKWYV